MYQELNDYLAYQGMKYIKPEKAGNLASEMETFKASGQKARQAFTLLAKELEKRLSPFEMDRVSNWANQAQFGRPHFWAYYHKPTDAPDDVALAIRLYGQKDDFGVSVEVSFIERKKSETTLAKQGKVLAQPIAEPLYYFVQVDGVSHRQAGTEANRLALQKALAEGSVRKILVKYDIPMSASQELDDLLQELLHGFDLVMPYYEVANRS